MRSLLAATLLLSALAHALPAPAPAPSPLAYVPPDPHKLFKRANVTYPTAYQVATTPRPEWLDAYNQAKAAGLIPSNVPVSTASADGSLTSYPNANMTAVCSWTTDKCYNPDDIHTAPPGKWGLGFDDGPTTASPDLYNFLAQNNQTASHFFIGSNVLSTPDAFQAAVNSGQHMCAHTWSHPPLVTSLPDTTVVAELGWSMQSESRLSSFRLALEPTPDTPFPSYLSVIYDQAGGRVVKYWRPPQGDVDNRVRAIAKYVFGMRTIMWSADADDWCLRMGSGSSCQPPDPGASYQSVVSTMEGFLNNTNKTDGLIILEHELTDQSVNAFKTIYPIGKANGWIPQAIVDLYGLPWYQNAVDSKDSSIQSRSDIVYVSTAAGNSPTSTPIPSSSASATAPVGTAAAASASSPAHKNSGAPPTKAQASTKAAVVAGPLLALLATSLLLA